MKKSLDRFWQQRFTALINGDYATVYRSYHQSAPFRDNFSCAREYVLFAQAQLGAIEVKDWQFVDFRTVGDDQVECIISMQLSCDGIDQYFYELALVCKNDNQWFYHSAQKLSAEDYSDNPDSIDFVHFDQVVQKIRL